MKTVTNAKEKIRRHVMRQVYLAYTANILSSKLLLYFAMFMVSLTFFREVVFVRRVLESLLNMPVSHIPNFIMDTIMRGEVLTLASLGIMVFTALTIQWRVRELIRPVAVSA